MERKVSAAQRPMWWKATTSSKEDTVLMHRRTLENSDEAVVHARWNGDTIAQSTFHPGKTFSGVYKCDNLDGLGLIACCRVKTTFQLEYSALSIVYELCEECSDCCITLPSERAT